MMERRKKEEEEEGSIACGISARNELFSANVTEKDSIRKHHHHYDHYDYYYHYHPHRHPWNKAKEFHFDVSSFLFHT